MIQIEPHGEDGTLSREQIAYLINNTTETVTKYIQNEQYFAGLNPTILTKTAPTNTAFPNNKIPVPYGRKISLTTKNYMFNRPVNYVSEDEEYLKSVQKVFFLNENDEKIDRIGLDIIVHGAGYKLFYFPEGQGKNPSYAILPGNQCIPVYNLDIEPKLICFIRYYTVVDPVKNDNDKFIVETYYETRFLKYEEKGSSITASMSLVDDTVHMFTQIPAVIYGDRYQLGVFDAVKKIIDGIDTITSSDMNEIEKFALAYLVLTGANIAQADLDETIQNKLFQLPDKDATLAYLTKNINNEFNLDVREFLVSEVHKQSGVPDFASKEFAADSGIALMYKLMGFENLASGIEKLFKKGEQESIDIINSVLYGSTDRFTFIEKSPDKIIKIIMSRNIPEDLKQHLDAAKVMLEVGLSLETIVDSLPNIEDTEGELERIAEQKEKNMELFGLNGETEEGDDDEDGGDGDNTDDNTDE